MMLANSLATLKGKCSPTGCSGPEGGAYLVYYGDSIKCWGNSAGWIQSYIELSPPVVLMFLSVNISLFLSLDVGSDVMGLCVLVIQ